MSDLLCYEGNTQKRAYKDPVFLKDNRVIQNLLKLEEFYTVPANYMDFQTDIKPYMRQIVAQWMLEVCEEQHCEEEVFGLAVNFMDRALKACVSLSRTRLQLLASACMFIASKLRETYPLSTEKLVLYTDNSISQQELLDWELLLLCKLKWDLGAVIPADYLDVFLDRLDLPSSWIPNIRSHALALISMSHTEVEFLLYPPSMVAAGTVCAAIESIISPVMASVCAQTLKRFAHIDSDCLRTCKDHVLRVSCGKPTQPNHQTVNEKKNKKVDSHTGTPTNGMEVEVF